MNPTSGAISKHKRDMKERVVATCSSSNEAVVKGGIWRLKKEDLQLLLTEKASGRGNFLFSSDLMTPSRCRTYQSLFFSNTKNEEHDTETRGKWMLYLDRFDRSKHTGLTALDEAWQKLIDIDDFASTGVMAVKCSTAFPDDFEGPYSGTKNPEGVICCYTPDYTNKAQVRKTAVAIRKLVNYPHDMFYKTDLATHLKKYSWKGDKNICLYKHTTFYELYEEKSVDRKWYPVYFEEDNVRRNADISSIVSKLSELLKEPRY